MRRYVHRGGDFTEEGTMRQQTGQYVRGALGTADVDFLCARGVEREREEVARELPAFVSAAPPRSEGEALLRRIFSRPEVV
jgi:hypothetical protein